MLETALRDYVIEQRKGRPECPKNIMRICDCKISHLSQHVSALGSKMSRVHFSWVSLAMELHL